MKTLKLLLFCICLITVTQCKKSNDVKPIPVATTIPTNTVVVTPPTNTVTAPPTNTVVPYTFTITPVIINTLVIPSISDSIIASSVLVVGGNHIVGCQIPGGSSLILNKDIIINDTCNNIIKLKSGKIIINTIYNSIHNIDMNLSISNLDNNISYSQNLTFSKCATSATDISSQPNCKHSFDLINYNFDLTKPLILKLTYKIYGNAGTDSTHPGGEITIDELTYINISFENLTY